MALCLNSDPEIKCLIKIWWDTGAFQSVMLHNVLPFTEKSALGSHALVKGFGEGFLTLPLHNLNLESELVSGEVVVALCSQIPIDGVSFIFGNDLAGGRVLVTPKVTSIPQLADVPDELEKMYPDTFPVCAVTPAMSRQKQVILKMSDQFDIGLSE